MVILLYLMYAVFCVVYGSLYTLVLDISFKGMIQLVTFIGIANLFTPMIYVFDTISSKVLVALYLLINLVVYYKSLRYEESNLSMSEFGRLLGILFTFLFPSVIILISYVNDVRF